MKQNFTFIERAKHWLFSLLLIPLAFMPRLSHAVVYTIGTTGTANSTTGVVPYSTYYHDNRIQYLYLASELTAAGATAGNINSLGFNITSLGSPTPLNVNIKIAGISNTITSITALQTTGMTNVYTAATMTPVVGWNTYTFSTPYFWNGVDNILIEVCRDNTSYSVNYGFRCTTFTTTRTFGYYADGVAGCSMTTGNTAGATAFLSRPDAQFDIVTGPACTNPPLAGSPVLVDSICPNVGFALVDTGATIGSGMTYQWEQSATGAAGSWSNVTSAVSPNSYLTAGITANTYFRMKAVCSGGTPVYSTSKLVAVKSWLNCFCVPTFQYGCTLGQINSFSTTGAMVNVSNLNSGCSPASYGNFMAMSISNAAGFPFNFNVSLMTYGCGVMIWADWNHDGVFSTSEICANSGATMVTSGTFTGTITPPVTALAGPTRLRVRTVYNTTNFDPCTTYSYGETEDYTINVVTPPACNTITFPTNVHSDASPGKLCVTGNVVLTIDSLMPQASGITYQWQSAPAATGPWTNLGTATATPGGSVTGLTATTYYRMQVLCNGSPAVTSSVDTVIVNNPGTVTGTNGQRCGPGQVSLGATPSIAGTQINWYTAATGGLPVATGPAYVTPYIPATTNFYAAAASGTSPVSQWVGTGTTALSIPNPYYNYYYGNKNQYLIRASELTALGFGPGTIQSIAFQVIGANTLALTNFEIKMKQTTLTALAAWETGMTTVYTNASYLPTASSTNVHTLSTPFVWDGASNIIIETCFNNTSYVSGNTVAGSTTSFNSSLYYYGDNAVVCSAPAYTYTSTSRPNIRFNMLVGCESPRVPVTATINPGPAATKSAPPVVCNNAVATLSMTPPTPNPYTPYKWYPITELYTDAAATIPYTGGSANTVYMKSSVAGQHTYYAIGGDTTVAATTCSRADTFNVWVQPGNQTITGFPDTICNSGTTVLTVVPTNNYYPNSLQWQQSNDNGATYVNIASANGTSYTTASLTANKYYRLMVNAGSSVCASPTKYIVVSTPSFVSKKDSMHCGPGSVTLEATTAGNSTPKWYESANGGIAIGSGSPWQTPYLTQTDTFWVVAGGGMTPTNVNIGSGTTTSTGAVSPFYGIGGGYRHQYLITAAEMTAAGATGGSKILNLAFDVVTSGATYNGFAVKMGHTTATTLVTSSWLPVTDVKLPANWTTTTGYNTLTFDVPFIWDGVSNVVVQTCWSNNNSSNTSNTVKYHTTSSAATHYNTSYSFTPADACNYTATGSVLSQRPNMRFLITKPCESTPRQMVIAYIRPVPAPNLGANIDTCINQGSTITLNPGTLPDNPVFVWDNGATTQTRGVMQTGIYNVKVTNTYGCVGRDTIDVNMKWNPVVDLAANGTGLCLGGTKVLDAGTGGLNGGNYYWNTGATSRTVTISNPGTYIAYVTSNQGCLTIDTVDIVPSGYMPTVDAIITQPLSATGFKFSVLNPQNVANFVWNFGDGSAPVTVPVSTSTVGLTNHTFPGGGNYNVTLKTYSVCGDITDSTMVTIIGGTGVNDIDKDAKLVQVYPNPNNGDVLYVEAVGAVKVKELVIYNAIGQEVLKVNAFESTTNKHKVTLPQHLAAGIYNIRINTDKGLTTRKLEIAK
jgi:hypothetical protein